MASAPISSSSIATFSLGESLLENPASSEGSSSSSSSSSGDLAGRAIVLSERTLENGTTKYLVNSEFIRFIDSNYPQFLLEQQVLVNQFESQFAKLKASISTEESTILSTQEQLHRGFSSVDSESIKETRRAIENYKTKLIFYQFLLKDKTNIKVHINASAKTISSSKIQQLVVSQSWIDYHCKELKNQEDALTGQLRTEQVTLDSLQNHPIDPESQKIDLENEIARLQRKQIVVVNCKEVVKKTIASKIDDLKNLNHIHDVILSPSDPNKASINETITALKEEIETLESRKSSFQDKEDGLQGNLNLSQIKLRILTRNLASKERIKELLNKIEVVVFQLKFFQWMKSLLPCSSFLLSTDDKAFSALSSPSVVAEAKEEKKVAGIKRRAVASAPSVESTITTSSKKPKAISSSSEATSSAVSSSPIVGSDNKLRIPVVHKSRSVMIEIENASDAYVRLILFYNACVKQKIRQWSSTAEKYPNLFPAEPAKEIRNIRSRKGPYIFNGQKYFIQKARITAQRSAA